MYNSNYDTLELKMYPEINEIARYPAYEDAFAVGAISLE
jgi:hypothetical protein